MSRPGEALGDELTWGERIGWGLLLMPLGEADESRCFEHGRGNVDRAGFAKERRGALCVGRKQGDESGAWKA